MSSNIELNHLHKESSDLKISIQDSGSPKIAALLDSTIYGTNGKLRYRQKEIVDRMNSQTDIEFIEISKRERVLGTAGIISRPTYTGSMLLNCRYVRYLSISRGFNNQNKRTKKENTSHHTKPLKKNSLKHRIGAKITEHFEAPFLQNNRKGAFYAFVEGENRNSRELCLSMGFTPIRKVHTLLFSRFNPTPHKEVSTASETDQEIVRKKLATFYKNYAFYFEDRIFSNGVYLLLKRNHTIIAGIRAIPVHWQVVDYPGLEGWLMRKVLPHLPLTNRLFSPTNFAFWRLIICFAKKIKYLRLYN